MEALDAEQTPAWVAAFYDTSSNFAGSTFALLEPNDARAITAADLLALRTLSIRLDAYEIRRILDEGSNAQMLTELLLDLPRRALQDTTADDFHAMASFYDRVKSLLATANTKKSNRWVAASKLTARKRPDLFPVRDRVVCEYLGILGLNDRARDWFVFRHLMLQPEIQTRLAELPEEIRRAGNNRPLRMDTEPLRLLDAVLWRYAMNTGKGKDSSTEAEDHRGEVGD